jgi:hypothetical protein
MIKKYLIYIGLLEDKSENKKSVVTKEVYSPATEIEVAKRYLDYLKEIDQYQKDRRTIIENKNSQLVGQASIVTSIFALFIPLLIDSFDSVFLWFKICFSTIFLFVLYHYLLTIFHAIKTLKINRYHYPTRRTTSVTKADRKEKELDFLNSEIEDLVYIINHTSPLDNIKGENLISASRCFEIANFGFGILAFIVIVSISVIKKDTKELKIKDLTNIHLIVPDTMNNRIINLQEVYPLGVKKDTSDMNKGKEKMK